jgi:hypothetical protein
MEEEEVAFWPKSSWQKDDCIRPGCQNKSTLEACRGKGNQSALVRCCADEQCKVFAVELARAGTP